LKLQGCAAKEKSMKNLHDDAHVVIVVVVEIEFGQEISNHPGYRTSI
jgi:hypothetical protein